MKLSRASVGLVLASIGCGAYGQGSIPTQHVTVGSSPLGTLSKVSMGVAVAVWDAHMMDKTIPGLIKRVGFEVVRYPGGSYADLYHWKTNSATKGEAATIRPGTDFDAFMKLCKASNATPLITVNYGSNEAGAGPATVEEAVDWVRYANQTKHYGVKYWEIGNEIYGNGFYTGAGWEVDRSVPVGAPNSERKGNPKLGPETYGKRVAEFARRMKAVDPTIKVGAVMVTPEGWWGDRQPSWNDAVLRACGSDIDFVVIHRYGEGKTPSEVLGSLAGVAPMAKRMRDEMRTALGDGAPRVKIWMTEGDCSGLGMKSEGALYAADHFFTYWENGFEHVNWWNLHNGLSSDGKGHFDDQGLLSSGHAKDGFSQPSPNTPFPPYLGCEMVGKLVGPGDTLLVCSGGGPNLSVHAAKRVDGSFSVLLVNKDLRQSARVVVNVPGVMPGARYTRFDYAPNATKLAASQGKVGQEMVVELPPAGMAGFVVGGSRDR